jgi:hypothetical protein
MTYHNPKEIENNFISNNIKIIKEEYYKIISTTFIKKNTIILIETPLFNLFGFKIDNMIIQMLYLLLKNKDNNYIKELYPREPLLLINNSSPYNINLIKIIKEYSDNKIKQFLLEFNKETLYQYYYKYLFNAFSMYSSPVILPIGAMMNHSCTPNIKFYEKNNAMYFETIKDIKPNEELNYSYLRNYKYSSNKEKYEYLINHYNFKCADCLI